MRAKLRGLIAIRRASASTPRSASGCSWIQLCSSRSEGRFATGARELDAELRLPAGPPQEQHELARDVARELAAEVVLQQREREVHARGDPGRRRDPPVAHVDAIGLDPHAREQAREVVAAAPVRGRATAVEQSRAREQERAAAHRRPRAARARPCAGSSRSSTGVARGAAHALAARDEQRVDRAAHVARGALRDQLEARRHAHRPRARRPRAPRA